MIEGVELKQLTRHCDERGYFQEIIRSTDDFFVGFGQWSVSSMYQGVIKGFHCHSIQYDYWICSLGTIKAVLVDLRNTITFDKQSAVKSVEEYLRLNYYGLREIPMPKAYEYLLGDNERPCILRIPPGVAHGLKVLQGPAHLMYITSHTYNPSDEGRIAHDALGYDWDKRDIR